MKERRPVLSVYEGFFSGGARNVHTGIVVEMHRRGWPQEVFSIASEARREGTVQRMHEDSCYDRLRKCRIPVTALDRVTGTAIVHKSFSRAELAVFAACVTRAGLVFSLKENPMDLINQADVDVPVIVGLHRSDPEHQGRSLDELRQGVRRGRVTALVACAVATKAAYVAAGIPDYLIHVIPNGVDLERFKPSLGRRVRLRQSLGAPEGAPMIVFAARYDDIKDVPLFLASARIFLEGHREAVVVMCGAGMSEANVLLRRDIKQAFGRSRLRGQLRLLGIRHDTEMLFAAADVVSSTSLSEAYSLSLVEGMVSGAVPVTTGVGDSPLIVSQGRGLVTTRDPGNIASAWHRAYAERPQFFAAIGRNRHEFTGERMIAAYDKLIGQHAK